MSEERSSPTAASAPNPEGCSDRASVTTGDWPPTARQVPFSSPNDSPNGLHSSDEPSKIEILRARICLQKTQQLLLRCQVIQIGANVLERQPFWHVPKRHKYAQPVIFEVTYSKIKYLAEEALVLAKAFGSDGLEARCEYWLGRGYGGLLMWSEAEHHFARALKLDGLGHGLGISLRPCEVDDIEILLHNVKERGEIREKMRPKASDTASNSSTPRTTSSESGGVRETPWLPNERVQKEREACGQGDESKIYIRHSRRKTPLVLAANKAREAYTAQYPIKPRGASVNYEASSEHTSPAFVKTKKARRSFDQHSSSTRSDPPSSTGSAPRLAAELSGLEFDSESDSPTSSVACDSPPTDEVTWKAPPVDRRERDEAKSTAVRVDATGEQSAAQSSDLWSHSQQSSSLNTPDNAEVSRSD